jgi:hypothetical protein
VKPSLAALGTSRTEIHGKQSGELRVGAIEVAFDPPQAPAELRI